jgi:hypothetical protein
MKLLYVAVNGDGIGEHIGNAILSDDHKTLSDVSKKFKAAHSQIEKWAEKKGGQVIASAGDESIFSLPEEAAGELEAIKAQYAQQSGATLTIGVGETISQASKALIYGKLNEKDQIVEYEPQMEDYINDEDGDGEDDVTGEPTNEATPATAQAQDEGKETDGFSDSGDDVSEPAQGEALNPKAQAQAQAQSEQKQDPAMDGKTPGQPAMDNKAPQDKSKQGAQLSGKAPEQTQNPLNQENPSDDAAGNPADDQVDPNAKDPTQPKHEQNMTPEANFVHDAKENEEDEADDDIIEADEEANVLGDETEPFVDQESEEVQESDNGDVPPLSDDEIDPGQESSEDQVDPNAEAGFGDTEQTDEATSQQGFGTEDQGAEGEGDDIGSEADAFLHEMMHSNIDGGAEGQDPAADGLKQNIFAALQSIKENREVLDQIKIQNPDLYQGIVANMQAMIEMGKQLGMGQPAMGSQDPNAIPGQDPMAAQQDPNMADQEQMPLDGQEAPLDGQEAPLDDQAPPVDEESVDPSMMGDELGEDEQAAPAKEPAPGQKPGSSNFKAGGGKAPFPPKKDEKKDPKKDAKPEPKKEPKDLKKP